MDSKLASNERMEFCERLTKALLEAGVTPKASVFTREFNHRADGATVSVHGARKWLLGEAIPTQERLHVLASWLKVSPQWLRFGEHSAGGDIAANDKELFPHEEVLLLTEYRRLEPDSQAVVRDLISSLLTHHALRK